MFQKLSYFIGWRFTRARRRTRFVSAFSMISIIGFTIGVLLLISVSSVMNGFDRELRERILGLMPQASVRTFSPPIEDWQIIRDRVLEAPDVLAAAPYLGAEVLISSASGVKPGALRGILPEMEATVSILPNYLTENKFDGLQAGEFNIILGAALAEALRVKIGDKITIDSSQFSITPMGIFPRRKQFTLIDTYQTGTLYDHTFGFIHLDDSKKLLRQDVNAIRLQFANIYAAHYYRVKEITDTLGSPFYPENWQITQSHLYQAIQLSKNLVLLMLIVVIAIAAFNVVSTMVMIVKNKEADIAILRTMGAEPRTIMGIFIVQGTTIGLIGTLLGAVLGIALSQALADIIRFFEQQFNFKFLDTKVYPIDYVPSELWYSDVITICIISVLMSFLATIYPARKASKITPAQVLRYE